MANFDESRIRIEGFLYPELSYALQGLFYNVVNKYGNGLKEKIYENALADELDIREIKYVKQKRINIYLIDTGKILGTFVPDLIVDEKIIIELKATNFPCINDVHQQQSYLKASMYEVAYLVNFGTPKIFIKRSIYTNNKKPFITRMTNRNS